MGTLRPLAGLALVLSTGAFGRYHCFPRSVNLKQTSKRKVNTALVISLLLSSREHSFQYQKSSSMTHRHPVRAPCIPSAARTLVPGVTPVTAVLCQQTGKPDAGPLVWLLCNKHDPSRKAPACKVSAA